MFSVRRSRAHREELRDEGEEQSTEPTRKQKFAPDPGGFGRKEWQQHQCTHLLFRTWCEQCMRGRAMASHRRHRQRDQHRIATIHMDYMFMGTEEDENTAPILVIKDDVSGATMSMLVPSKGNSTPWVHETIVSFVDFLG